MPFHSNTHEDYVYAIGPDKLGHAFFANAAATVYGDLMRWCGMDSTSAIWKGFGVAMTYQTLLLLAIPLIISTGWMVVTIACSFH